MDLTCVISYHQFSASPMLYLMIPCSCALGGSFFIASDDALLPASGCQLGPLKTSPLGFVVDGSKGETYTFPPCMLNLN